MILQYVYLLVGYLSVYLSIYLSILSYLILPHLPYLILSYLASPCLFNIFIYLSIYLSIYRSIYLSVSLLTSLPIYPSTYLSIYIYLSACLSTQIHLCICSCVQYPKNPSTEPLCYRAIPIWKTYIFTIPLISSPLRIPEMIKTKYGASQSTALSKLEDQIANNRELAKALKGSLEESGGGDPSPSGSVPGESGSRTLASPDFTGAVDVPNFTTRVVLESKPIDDFYNGRTFTLFHI